MGLQERHEKAIAKMRAQLKGINGINYDKEEIFGPADLGNEMEWLGALRYDLLDLYTEYVIIVRHVGRDQFEVELCRKDYKRGRTGGGVATMTRETVGWRSLRGRVKAIVTQGVFQSRW